MQTTEELLAQLEAEAQSEIPVCVIDPETRTITVPPEYQLLGVENDKRVERLYFQCQKVVGDNQDLSRDYILFINYVNANGDPDAYKINDMQVEGDNITFSWLLEEKVTLYQGDIQISFCGIVPGDEQEAPDKNRWGTTINTDCTVLTGLKCTQQVAESNPDALAQIWAAIDELKAGGGGAGTSGKDGREIEIQNNGIAIQWRYVGDDEWTDLVQLSDLKGEGIPEGGTTGQVLTKNSDSDGDASWKDPSAVSDEQVKTAVDNYLKENPVQGGITEEQKQQLEQNTQDITDLKNDKLDSNQGIKNKGKSMVVAENGGLVPGSIAEENTSFFKRKQIGEAVDIYSSIVKSGVLINENYSQTNGYYVSMVSEEYSALRMTEDASKVSFFRKVKMGETVIFRGQSNQQLKRAVFVSKDIYDLIMSGYQSDIGSMVDWEYIVNIDVIVNSLGQIRQDLTPKLFEIWPDKVGYYASEFIFESAPFDGYLLFTQVYNTISSIGDFPTYEYESQANYGYTLEDTLKNDPFIGEQMKKLLGISYDDINIKTSKFNFSAMTDAIVMNTSISAVLEKLTEPLGTLQYVGGICANKKIYCSPNTADSILVYDTEREYYYKIATDLGSQSFKWTGFVAWNGLLYAVPRGVNQMLQVNPVTDEVKIVELKTEYPVTPYGDYRDSHHYNGVISDDGFMYLPPSYSSDKLLKINMEDFTHEELDFTSDDVSTWIGCAKHPTENKIIFLSTKVFRIWNCEDDTYTDIVDGTTRSCYDMVYDPRYNSFVGVYPNHVFALNLADSSIIDSGYINYLSTGYGICLGADGKYYHLEGAKAFVFSFNGKAFTEESSITTSENVGSSTPVLAGQAIANNGDIYGIPASGSMIRLKFSGVVRELPDYIVSSQYYGKY